MSETRPASQDGIFEDEDPELADNHEFDHALAAGTEALSHGKPAEARLSLEKALRYKPNHQKAQNYLGLALAQKGELLRAREWFLKAGNEAMAQRMAQALQASPIRDVAAGAEEKLQSHNPFRSVTEESDANDTQEMARPKELLEEAQKHWVATSPATLTAPPVAPKAAGPKTNSPEPTQPPAATPAEAVAEVAAPPAVSAPPEPAQSMAQYTRNTRLSVPPSEGSGFAIGPSEVVVHVKGEILTRLDGLVASWGQVTMKPEMKRFRGKATDKPFGDGSRRMLRASGEGRFVVARDGRRFTALELGDEPAYFREEILYAFEESILFENGRVPSKGGTDLHLVHLRGNGRLLLATNGMPQAVDVLRGEALRIPMEQLVGWHGPLIQPRLVPIVEEAPEMGTALELVGEGKALLDVPVSE